MIYPHLDPTAEGVIIDGMEPVPAPSGRVIIGAPPGAPSETRPWIVPPDQRQEEKPFILPPDERDEGKPFLESPEPSSRRNQGARIELQPQTSGWQPPATPPAPWQVPQGSRASADNSPSPAGYPAQPTGQGIDPRHAPATVIPANYEQPEYYRAPSGQPPYYYPSGTGAAR